MQCITAALAGLCTAAVVLGSCYTSAAPALNALDSEPLPALPAGWPDKIHIGMGDPPGGAAKMQATAKFGFRYQYLAGGANTNEGWATWSPDGSFVSDYIQESAQNSMIPVFTYYMLVQSAPGNAESEGNGAYANLQNVSTMEAYYRDLKLFFQRAGAYPDHLVVLHVEPDLWGFMEARARRDDATTVPTSVAGTGLPELADIPDNFAGFGHAIVKLRDLYAPNVLLAFHLSVWGPGNDILYSKPPTASVRSLAARAAQYFLSLDSGFDLVFSEFSDRDAAFKQFEYGDGGASWWGPDDFERNLMFLSTFVRRAHKRIVMWQIPFGNTRMRAMNNSWNHYQDNKVEWLLDDPTRRHLDAYIQAGVVAFLFGRGADGATCACDADEDGITNPEPINGNTLFSFSADDDGGYFRKQAAAYYTLGALALP